MKLARRSSRTEPSNRKPSPRPLPGLGVAFALLGWLLGCHLCMPTYAQKSDPAFERAVANAIEQGVAWLRDRQSPQGIYSLGRFNLGMTALAGLAFLENGVPANDPAIAKIRGVVLETASRDRETYNVALAILFLTRLRLEAQPDTDPGDASALDQFLFDLARRLDAGEAGGMWDYNVPIDDDPALAASARRRAERRANRLEPEPETPPQADSPIEDRRPRRPNRPKRGDNSNTQFALLGLWAAGRAGDPEAGTRFDCNGGLEAIDRHFRETRNPRGGWGYRPGAGDTPAMTCAGLMGLAIGASRPERAELRTARARGADLANDPAFREALAVVARDVRTIGPQSDVYYLWSLERVCVALGLTELDGVDWYRVGAEELIRRQRPDGSWPDHPGWGALPNTALALLFLRKANLAFELDRVLRLPPLEAGRPDRPAALTPVSFQQSHANDEPFDFDLEDNAALNDPNGVRVIIRSADETNFPKITLDFEVKGPDGKAITSARKEDFKVTEYDREVEILDFVSPKGEVQLRPTTVVLVLDTSGSMLQDNRIGALKEAVGVFLGTLPPGSKVAVIEFNSFVNPLVFGPANEIFTTRFDDVKSQVNRFRANGGTSYYDAVDRALELIANQTGRRAVLALTDGEDTSSRLAGLDSVILKARNLGLPVHTLGVGREDEIEVGELQRLARETRGRYFPARDATKLRVIFAELAQSLRESYSLTYRTDRDLPDGTLRPVKVFYRERVESAGERALYIPGMVVPATGWSPLFLGIVAGLIALAVLPGRLKSRPAA